MSKELSGVGDFIEDNRLIIMVIVTAIGLLIFSGWYWWNRVYESQTNVFYGMIDNNLNISNVTKSFNVVSNGAELKESVQLQVGARNVAHSFTTFSQSTGVIKTEELNTPTDDYIRYTQITTDQKDSTGKKRDFTPLINFWGRQSLDKTSTDSLGTIYYQTLGGILPFGNLTDSQRDNLLKFVKTNKVYQFSSNQTKRSSLNGQLVYVYTMKLNQASYLKFIQQYSKYMGLPAISSLDITQLQNAPTLTFKVTVNASSRQLVELDYPDGVHKELYSNFDLKTPNIPALPKATIPLTQLRDQLNFLATD